MNWDQIVEKVSPHLVKIETPSGHGSGFLYLYNHDNSWCAIATAMHVIDQADEWQQPIRIRHYESGQFSFLKQSERIIFKDEKTDSAVILFLKGDLPLPEEPISLLGNDSAIGIGSDVGWLGFPSIAPHDLCFFSGNVSSRQDWRKAYLIDGVAINGVSGGPVLYSTETDGVQIVGAVSAYSANRATGETLPGLLIAQDVSNFHEVADHVRSADDAMKKKQEFEKENKKSEGVEN